MACRNPEKKSRTVIDSRKQELSQRELKLRREREALEKQISEAPQKAAAAARHEQEERNQRASERMVRIDNPAPYRLNTATTARPRNRQLKAEQRASMIQFFVLCIILAGLVLWILSRMR